MSDEIQLSGDAVYGVGPRAMMATAAALPMTVRLGRLPGEARPRSALPFGQYWDPAAMAAPPPASINRRDKAAASMARMYLNDRYGCCVISGKAHNLGLWSANDEDSGGVVLATDAEIQSQYFGICGPGDNGCVITRVLDVMRDRGFVAGGKTYKIDGYVSVDWSNKLKVQVAQVVFGASSIGFDLPEEWLNAAVWKPTNSRIVGGHDVSPIDYDEQGVYVASWGRIYLFTWDAFLSRKWISEYFAMLAPLWYGSDQLAPNGVNVAKLKADLDQFKGGGVPDLEPPVPDWGDIMRW